MALDRHAVPAGASARERARTVPSFLSERSLSERSRRASSPQAAAALAGAGAAAAAAHFRREGWRRARNWQCLFATINAAQAARLSYGRRPARLSDAEQVSGAGRRERARARARAPSVRPSLPPSPLSERSPR